MRCKRQKASTKDCSVTWKARPTPHRVTTEFCGYVSTVSRFSVCRYEPSVETQAGIFQVLVTPLAMACTVFCFDKVSKEFRSSSIFFYFYKSGLPIQFQERVASHIWSDTTLQILYKNCAIWLSNTYMKTGPKSCIWCKLKGNLNWLGDSVWKKKISHPNPSSQWCTPGWAALVHPRLLPNLIPPS